MQCKCVLVTRRKLNQYVGPTQLAPNYLKWAWGSRDTAVSVQGNKGNQCLTIPRVSYYLWFNLLCSTLPNQHVIRFIIVPLSEGQIIASDVPFWCESAFHPIRSRKYRDIQWKRVYIVNATFDWSGLSTSQKGSAKTVGSWKTLIPLDCVCKCLGILLSVVCWITIFNWLCMNPPKRKIRRNKLLKICIYIFVFTAVSLTHTRLSWMDHILWMQHTKNN